MNIMKAADMKIDKLSVLIYGSPGMGKTTLLGNQKGRTLIIDIEKGTTVLAGCKNVDVVHISDIYSDLQAVIKELQAKCDYDNVCIDSLSELERSYLTMLSVRNGTGVAAWQDYSKANNFVLNCCRQLRSLNANVFFTAWESYIDMTAPSGDKYTRIVPMLRDKNMDNVCGLCDIVGRICTDSESNERKVWLEGRANVLAKDRIFKRRSCKFDDVLGNKDNEVHEETDS